MVRLGKFLVPLALVLGVLTRIDAADLKSEDVQAVVKKYAADSKTDLKPIEALSDLIDVAKFKEGKGLEVAKDYKFTWTVSAKKKLAAADLQKVETTGRDFLEKAITALGKDDLKLDEEGAKAAIEGAKKATFRADEGSGVGPSTGVTGELALSGLTEAGVKEAVVNYLKANQTEIKKITDLVHLADITSADGLKYEYSTNSPVFAWTYAAKKEKVGDDDQKKITESLQAVISTALSAEKDKAKKLKPADLDTAKAAAGKAKTEPKKFSRMYDLSADTFKKWVVKYLSDEKTKKPEEQVLKDLKKKVEEESILEAPLLLYVPESKKLIWEYNVVRGYTMNTSDPTDIAAQLKALLADVIKDATKASTGEYPEGDRAALNAIVEAGEYTAYTEAGLTPQEVTQAKVREMMSKTALQKDRKALKDAGVALLDDTDFEVLLSGLTYKTDKDLKEIEFGWTYRWADAAKAPEAADKDKIAKLLRDLLTSAFVTGGNTTSLRMDKGDFESYFKKPIADMQPNAVTEFSLKQVTPTVVFDMVNQYISTRRPSQAKELEKFIIVSNLYDPNVLTYTYDAEKVSFKLEIPTNPNLDKDIPNPDQDKVKEAVKEVLALAFTKPVGGDARKLNKADMEKVTDAIKKADITILPLKDSKLRQQVIAVEAANREIRRQQILLAQKIRDLEEKVASLQTPTATAQPYVRYEVQRSGLLGCRRQLVPVVVYP